MKAEVGQDAVAQTGQLMLKSDKLELERGAAAKTENQDRQNGRENRHHDRDGTANSQRSPASLSLARDPDHARSAPLLHPD